MPERKRLNWVDDYSTDAQPTPEPAANDADGWQQYREWVTKAPAPRTRRAGVDPSLYTWKGYRMWSEQIKRNWNPDESD